MNNHVREDFAKWAGRFGGMDGGNLDGPLWFCGMEFGSHDNAPISFATPPKCLENRHDCAVPYASGNREYDFRHQYDCRVAKVAAHLLRGSLQEWRAFRKDEMCASNGRIFKLNLYPINFPNTDDRLWTATHEIRTGFSSKCEYKAWCVQNRFPFIRSLIQSHKPKVLICTGKKAKSDFRLAFAPASKVSDETYFASRFAVGKHEVESFLALNGSTLVFVTPFFGRGGLMSDQHLTDLADVVRSATSL